MTKLFFLYFEQDELSNHRDIENIKKKCIEYMDRAEELKHFTENEKFVNNNKPASIWVKMIKPYQIFLNLKNLKKNKGIDTIKQAMALENIRNYPMALDFYERGIENLIFALKCKILSYQLRS